MGTLADSMEKEINENELLHEEFWNDVKESTMHIFANLWDDINNNTLSLVESMEEELRDDELYQTKFWKDNIQKMTHPLRKAYDKSSSSVHNISTQWWDKMQSNTVHCVDAIMEKRGKKDDDKQEQHRKQQPLASLIHNATTKIMNDAWNVTTNMVADLVHDTMEDMTQKRDSSSSTTIIFEIVKNGIRDILGNGEEVFQNNHNSKDDDDKDSSSRKTTPPTTTIKKMNQVWNTMDSFLTNFMDKGEK